MARTTHLRVVVLVVTAATIVAIARGSASQGPAPQQPARDTPAQRQDAPEVPAGLIAGRVLAADTGRPVKGARVNVSASLSGAGSPEDDLPVLADWDAGRPGTDGLEGRACSSQGQRGPQWNTAKPPTADRDIEPAAARQRDCWPRARDRRPMAVSSSECFATASKQTVEPAGHGQTNDPGVPSGVRCRATITSTRVADQPPSRLLAAPCRGRRRR